MRSRLLAVAASTILLTTLAACGGSDDDSSSSDAPTKDAASSGTCQYREKSEPGTKAKLPPSDPETATSATIKTNLGDIGITFSPDTAPCTVSSFVSLAKQGYYDGTQCHRLVPTFVLQCGDPTATGTGGPGYEFDDELSGSEQYPAGTLAMANAGPNTNGSQFFIVLDENTENLGPKYTVFGKVDAAGLALAKKVEAAGVGPDGTAPAQEVKLESVTVS
jgi:peptidyl-prolyl cis-trans isomerase B (cyclophilin B)